MPKSRDDFPKEVRRELCLRVASICSCPTCRKVTTGPTQGMTRSTIIGKAAHIHAASSGGPRYLESMTAAERKHFNNGIWLCSDCAVRIDMDPLQFPAEILREWKATAEAEADARLGRKSGDKGDIAELLSQTLGAFPKRLIPEGIHNVHRASAIALEGLDPHFSVKTSYRDGVTAIEVQAKGGPRSFTMSVSPGYQDEFAEKYRALIEVGAPLNAPAGVIAIGGSPLFAALQDGDAQGTWTISPRGEEVRVQIAFFLDESQSENIEGKGTLSKGLNGMTVIAVFLDGLIEVRLSTATSDGPAYKKWNVTFNLSQWEGCDIRGLRYFSVLKSFSETIRKGAGVQISLQRVEGDLRWYRFSGTYQDEPASLNLFIDFIDACRTVAEFCKASIKYWENYSTSVQDANEIRKVAEMIEGRPLLTRAMLSAPPTVELSGYDYEELSKFVAKENATVRAVQSGTVINILGQEVQIPYLGMIYENSIFSVYSQIPRDETRDSIVIEIDGKDLKIRPFVERSLDIFSKDPK